MIQYFWKEKKNARAHLKQSICFSVNTKQDVHRKLSLPLIWLSYLGGHSSWLAVQRVQDFSSREVMRLIHSTGSARISLTLALCLPVFERLQKASGSSPWQKRRDTAVRSALRMKEKAEQHDAYSSYVVWYLTTVSQKSRDILFFFLFFTITAVRAPFVVVTEPERKEWWHKIHCRGKFSPPHHNQLWTLLHKAIIQEKI